MPAVQVCRAEAKPHLQPKRTFSAHFRQMVTRKLEGVARQLREKQQPVHSIYLVTLVAIIIHILWKM